LQRDARRRFRLPAASLMAIEASGYRGRFEPKVARWTATSPLTNEDAVPWQGNRQRRRVCAPVAAPIQEAQAA